MPGVPEPVLITLAASLGLRLAMRCLSSGDTKLPTSVADLLGNVTDGVSSNAAYAGLKRLLNRAQDFEIDPRTRCPRNDDLQKASRDSLRAAARALMYELATRLQVGQFNLAPLADHLDRGLIGRWFGEDAVGSDPVRQWVVRLWDVLDGKGFEVFHDGLRLAEEHGHPLLAANGTGFDKSLAGRFGEWARSASAADTKGEPPQFAGLLEDGWRIGEQPKPITLGRLHEQFFHECLKRRPAVFQACIAGELDTMRMDAAGMVQRLEHEIAQVDGALGGLDDQVGRLLRRQTDLVDKLDEVLARIAILLSARQSRHPDAEGVLQRLTEVASSLDHFAGGIPRWILSQPGAPRSETHFLTARYRVLPLTGRGQDLAELRAWLAAPEAVSARLLIGPAGTGKTRLALELADEVARHWAGWDVGVLDSNTFSAQQYRDPTRMNWTAPTLLVVDYAQTLAEPLGAFLSALNRLDPRGRHPLRILLLERMAGEWFEMLLRMDETSSYGRGPIREMFHPPHAVPVTPLSAGEIRRGLLAEALRQAASLPGHRQVALPPSGADAEVDRALNNPQFENPLQVAMVAVVAAGQGDLRGAFAYSSVQLAGWVAQREQKRIERHAPSHATDEQRKLLARLAACATMERGLTADELARAVAEESEERRLDWPGGQGELESVLRRALPPSNDKLAVAPIEPDFVGESFMLSVLAKPVAGAGRDGWQPWHDVVRRCAEREPVAAPASLVHAWQNLGHSPDYGGPLLAATDALIDLATHAKDVRLLRGLAEAMPKETLEFRERAERIAGLLYVHARDAHGQTASEANKAALAFAANTWAWRLSEMGKPEEALTASQESVGLYRGLAEKNPDAFRPNLAMVLNNLATHLGRMGKPDEALTAAQESAALWRSLAEKNPDAFRPDLARALNNLAHHSSEMGKPDEALTAAQESVDLRRVLAEKNPDAFSPNLALALNTLAICSSARGKPDEALMAAQQAADLFRSLAKKNPDAFSPNLAKALAVLGNRLLESGLHADSAEAHREGAQILLPYFQKWPAAHGRLLAVICLDYLAACEKANVEPNPELLAVSKKLNRPAE